MDRLSNSEIAAAGLTDWRKLAQALHARFTGPPADLARFAVTVSDEFGGEPELRLARGVLDVTVCTQDGGRWVTAGDLDTARRISELAAQQRLAAAPGEVAQLELGLDTARAGLIGPFWAALLTGSADTVHGEVLDPTQRTPNVWFQESEQIDPPPQRWHIDLWLAPEVAERRIQAAVAAGGTVEYTDEAPAFTVLADPDGNRVCICTSLERG